MIVGFTGTRKGMNARQVAQLMPMLHAFWQERRATPFHFGGAYGADLEARKAAKAIGYDIEWHPAPSVDLGTLAARGYAPEEEMLAETWHEVFAPLVRNRHIVNAVAVLLAAPHVDVEEQRSGTWATIRYARAKGIPVVMLSRGGGK